jgi:hypothetical protein
MLEILIVASLGNRLAKLVRAKGRHPFLFVALLVVLWVAGEFAGAFLGSVVTGLTGQSDGLAFALICGFTFAGAAAGAILTFAIARTVPAIEGMAISAAVASPEHSFEMECRA